MKLEDTIRYRLFTRFPTTSDGFNINGYPTIECKAERGKPIPLCMGFSLGDSDLVYHQINAVGTHSYIEKSTPRAMYNNMFGAYNTTDSLYKVKVKDSYYHIAPGVLFDDHYTPLFYFAQMTYENQYIPMLFITPTLLGNASIPGKPMEKFFMGTIIPFLVSNEIKLLRGYAKVVINVDNRIDEKFFLPNSTPLVHTSVETFNEELNDRLLNNADMISGFINNYIR